MKLEDEASHAAATDPPPMPSMQVFAPPPADNDCDAVDAQDDGLAPMAVGEDDSSVRSAGRSMAFAAVWWFKFT